MAGRIKDIAPFMNIDYGINVMLSVVSMLYSVINIHNVSGAAGNHCQTFFFQGGLSHSTLPAKIL